MNSELAGFVHDASRREVVVFSIILNLVKTMYSSVVVQPKPPSLSPPMLPPLSLTRPRSLRKLGVMELVVSVHQPPPMSPLPVPNATDLPSYSASELFLM